MLRKRYQHSRVSLRWSTRLISALVLALAGFLVSPASASAGEGSVHCGILVYGSIEDKYLQLGAKGGFLGCPHGPEGDAGFGGRWEAFQGGVIYWHPAAHIQAHAVTGAILAKWDQYGRESNFGYPLTDELTTPDGIGRYNHFERASIYWTLQTGAHPVYGAIRDRWAALGWENSCLGYPLSDEVDTPGGGGRFQTFQRGSMFWTPAGGAHPTC